MHEFFLAGAFQTLSKNCATCLGKFDALHLGHASLAQRAREDLQMEPGMTLSCLADNTGELLTPKILPLMRDLGQTLGTP